MRSVSDLHAYQQKAINFQCSHAESAMWMDMGLGKTAITLTSIAHLIKTEFLKAVIVVAPIRVCRLVWKQESVKWSHTNHLKFSMITGTRDQRTRALMQTADVYLINYENLKWLGEVLHTYYISKDRPLPFDGIVWDEISKCKNSSTQRVKSVRKILPHLKWKTGLTGTPASNGYKDLHGQYLVLDEGHRLGTSKTAFKTKFYRKDGPYTEVPYSDTEETIKNLIGDITLEMSAADYNPLPDMIANDINIELPDDLRKQYDKMEREFFIALDSGTEVEMFNQASLTNKCLQFSNGAMYPVAGMPLWETIHDLKLDALEEIIDEANGQPILCSYAYRSDAQRIMERFKDLRPINLTECKSETALNNAMARWKAGDCQLMVGHPACLHPQTQVLTKQRGWISLIDVESSDLVFDGVEFVSHDGCSYSGFKDVIEVLGITMTPNHKLLLSNKWVEAKNVRDCAEVRNEALRLREKTETNSSSSVLDLWKNVNNASSKCHEKQSRKSSTLQSMYNYYFSPSNRYSHLEDMVGDDVEREGYNRQKLRRARNRCVSGVAEFLSILHRYGRELFGQLNYRASGCQQGLFQRKLCVGNQYGSTIQQTNQSQGDVSGRGYSFSRIMSKVWAKQNEIIDATQSRNDSRRGSSGCEELKLWQEFFQCEHSQTRKAQVYDLVNCGPRHQFVIRNAEGEVYISHNSMGHGVDGLQDRGHIIVWFGLTWSLDLYDQMNARLRRQGQGVPVVCHRIMTLNTLDQAQAIALDEKAVTQDSLRKAIKSYRERK